MRFEVLTVVKMAFVVFWVATTYKTTQHDSPEDHDQHRLRMFENMW
jgi:hypothetical protein